MLGQHHRVYVDFRSAFDVACIAHFGCAHVDKTLAKGVSNGLVLAVFDKRFGNGRGFATFFTIVGTRNNTETVGLFNMVLGWFGIDPVDWIGKAGGPTWEIGSLTIPWPKYIVMIIYEVWSGLPFKF